MTNLFRNSSPGALTMQQAIAQAKKRAAEHVRQMRQARDLAAQGRGEDTEVAHVARGEYVIPEALQTPEVVAALERAAADYGVPLERLNVGHAMNSINPETGAPEFGFFGDWLSGRFAEGMSNPKMPLPAPQQSVDNVQTPTFEALGFDPNGPGKWGAFIRDPVGAWKADSMGAQAREEAKNRFDGEGSLVDGPGDAWRHARWNQLMTNELGPVRAQAFADAYERAEWDKNTPGQRLMDLYNNQVGRTLPGDPKGHMNPDTVLQNALWNGYLRRKPF
jgi:hypothetical protein